MERKTKHRILGVFSLLALIVILLPLFQTGSEAPTETKLVKAPPFPDQSVQVATPAQASPDHPVIPVQSPHEAENDATPMNDVISAVRPTVVNELSSAQEDNSSSKVAEMEPALAAEGDDFKAQTTQDTPPSNGAAAVKMTDASDKPVSGEAILKPIKLAAVKNAKLVQTTDKTKPVVKLASVDKKRSPIDTKTPLTDNGLIELKNAVWVIQIGSFKNKANALRLVNQLRSNGYRAFIQQISNTFGENTRVFVGPEYKRHSARALAMQLESDMHIRGIVISYKPLSL